MAGKPDLDDYVPVAQRIAQFRAKHPQGSLQPADPAHPFAVVEVGQDILMTYVAAAYREPGDPRPGIGCASEPYPGRTPYTRGSELMNAETSAWGRAIVAALAADTQVSVASAEEVRNRQAERDDRPFQERPTSPSREWGNPASPYPVPEEAPGSVLPDQLQRIGILFGKLGIKGADEKHAETARILGLREPLTTAKTLSHVQAAKLIGALSTAAKEKEGASENAHR